MASMHLFIRDLAIVYKVNNEHLDDVIVNSKTRNDLDWLIRGMKLGLSMEAESICSTSYGLAQLLSRLTAPVTAPRDPTYGLYCQVVSSAHVYQTHPVMQ
ncbi:unnamed protein product [Umbelopsis ramanniana]